MSAITPDGAKALLQQDEPDGRVRYYILYLKGYSQAGREHAVEELIA